MRGDWPPRLPDAVDRDAEDFCVVLEANGDGSDAEHGERSSPDKARLGLREAGPTGLAGQVKGTDSGGVRLWEAGLFRLAGVSTDGLEVAVRQTGVWRGSQRRRRWRSPCAAR